MIRSVAVVCLAITACVPDSEDLEVPDADAVKFRAEVYPILLADCGFPACHGTTERFFAVFGPGRTRLEQETDPYAPATPDELALSYTRARSMLLSPDGIRRSPLLRKPLAISAGGASHEGNDPWGTNVYANKQDPRFVTLFLWATAEGTR